MRVNANAPGDFSKRSNFSSEAVVTALTAYLSDKAGLVDFDAIKADVAPLAGAADGIIHQACFDAGFTDVSAL